MATPVERRAGCRGDGQILLCQDEGGCYLDLYTARLLLGYHMGFMHRLGFAVLHCEVEESYWVK